MSKKHLLDWVRGKLTAVPQWLPLILIVLVVGAMTVGSILPAIREQYAKETAQLEAVVELKVQQIADWLHERRGDAQQIHASPFLTEAYRRWREFGDLDSRDRLEKWFDQFRKNYNINRVLLLDEGGEAIWDSAGGIPTVAPALSAAGRRAVADQRTDQLGPYRDPAGRIWLDFLAPLPALDGRPGPVVVIRADLADYLYPTLKAWPVPSASGEILLFRRDGDDILYLNDLRYRADAALRLRLPATQERLLAARIPPGGTPPGRVIEAVDYRGVPVIGRGRTVPGTDWYLVAKMDRAEVHAGAASTVLGIGLIGLLVLVVTGTGAVLWRQGQNLATARREHALQAEKLQALRLLDAIATTSTDAISAKDPAGRYLLFNPGAVTLTGQPAEAVLGRDDSALFPAAQAERIMATDRQLLAEDHLVTVEEELQLADGPHTLLTTKGPLRDADGTLHGLFGISRDITARKRAEEALRASEAFTQAILNSVEIEIVVLDHAGVIQAVNEPWRQRALENGPAPGQPVPHTEVGANYLEHGLADADEAADTQKIRDGILVVLEGRRPRFSLEYPCHSPNQERWFAMTVTPFSEGGGDRRGAVVSHHDITQRKITENKLQYSEMRRAVAMRIARLSSWEWDMERNIFIPSEEFQQIHGIRAATLSMAELMPLAHPDDALAVQHAFERAINHGQPYAIEHRILRRDNGEMRFVAAYGEVVVDEAGRPIRIIGTSQDITEQKRVEQELLASRAELVQQRGFLKTLIQTIP
ncbi:MAG: PAS domain-containing protein, partial [Candidatus Competibacteraceae bacterium]